MNQTTRKIRCPTCGSAAGKSCRSVKGGKPLSDDHANRRLISINEAVRMGHPRLRKPVWCNAVDHVKIDLIDGAMGPWIHLYAPFNKEVNGRDPVDVLAVTQRESFDNPEFEIYDGPLPNSEEYQRAINEIDASARVLGIRQ